MKRTSKKVNLLSVKLITEHCELLPTAIEIGMYVRYPREIRYFTHKFNAKDFKEYGDSYSRYRTFCEEVTKEFAAVRKYGNLEIDASSVCEIYHAFHGLDDRMDTYLSDLEVDINGDVAHILGIVRATFRSLFKKGHYKRYNI